MAACHAGGRPGRRTAGELDHTTDRIERYLLARFPEGVRIERRLVSFKDLELTVGARAAWSVRKGPRRRDETRLYSREREQGGSEPPTMPKNRMRRVNEAVREVLSVAITSDLKDPRIGFVTVTAVDTSPDLRHAHVT